MSTKAKNPRYLQALLNYTCLIVWLFSETHVFDGKVELFTDLAKVPNQTELESKSLLLQEREAAPVTNGVVGETEDFPASPQDSLGSHPVK